MRALNQQTVKELEDRQLPTIIYDVDIGQIWRDTVSTLRVDDNVIVYEYYNKDAR